jgi:acyl dehydratase
MTPRYLEDFAVGQTYGSGRIRIEGDRIKSFAAEFDPQPFHLDDDAARNGIFRGLAASGWPRIVSSPSKSGGKADMAAPTLRAITGREQVQQTVFLFD